MAILMFLFSLSFLCSQQILVQISSESVDFWGVDCELANHFLVYIMVTALVSEKEP